jgi:hypothetical protein
MNKWFFRPITTARSDRSTALSLRLGRLPGQKLG